ncbi:GNAT family N-acetyltransferase [Cognatilysobacter segetis]|uniref:GNAT family N-acetyltransferase n=1 Tax=Cognatilysobacter segetis TaxID=2492394 RepID=UPI00105F9F61|nr:GNAT family N-acetyltransferase [Lysobacter segetis]
MTTVMPAPVPTETHVALRDGRHVLIRALRPTDAQAQRRFIERLPPEDRRARFLCTMSEVDDALLALLMAPDARGPTAVVALTPGENGEDIVGVARLAQAGDTPGAEISVSVDAGWRGAGLGTALFRALCMLARRRGITRLWSMDAASNAGMHGFAKSLGAHCRRDPDDVHQVIYELELH